MSNTLAFIMALLGVVLVIAVAYMLPGGCSGNCRQGRDPCDCKDNK